MPNIEKPIEIVNFEKTKHLAAVRHGSMELQDFERDLDPRLPGGSEIVDVFVPQMLQRCKEADGAVLIAECDSEVAGFATVLSRVSSEEIHEGRYEYGLISDLVVFDEYRNRGIGTRLLRAAEQFARDKGVSTIRIGVLSSNTGANQLYNSNGYKTLFVELEKDLNPPE